MAVQAPTVMRKQLSNFIAAARWLVWQAPFVREPEVAPTVAAANRLAQDQIRIFRVGFKICGDKGTDHIDLHVIFSRPVEGGLGQG